MQMPQVRDEHRKLHALAGTWTGDEIVHPSPWDPKGGPARGRIEARVVLDGFFLASDYVEERDGRVCYRGHGVYGWDAAQGCYTMYWFDSMGDGPAAPLPGTWQGNVLRFERSSPMGLARYTYTFESADRYRFEIHHSADGERWAPFMEAVYLRG